MVSSFVPWSMSLFLILHAAPRRYAEAKDAYLKAHTLDPDNIQILIDLSCIQLQVRSLLMLSS